MKILITGATGYVGTTLVPYLTEHGFYELCLLMRNIEKAQCLIPGKYEYIDSSIDRWQQAVIDYNPDVVINLAGLLNSRNDKDIIQPMVESNLLFITHLLEAISHTTCQYLIHTATFWEYEEDGHTPRLANTLYTATKQAEHPILNYYQSISQWKQIEVVLYTAYGKRSTSPKVLDLLYDALDAVSPQPFTNGEQVLDFVHIDDIANFYYTLICKLKEISSPYTQFHVGTGEGHSLREIASIMESVTGKRINAQWGVYPYRPNELMKCVAPVGKTKETLNWVHKKDIYDSWRDYEKQN